MTNQNPFEYMQSFMNQESFNKNFQSAFTQFDMNNLSNAVKNTADAIAATNKMAAETIQSIFKRGAENLQRNSSEMYNSMKDAVSSGDAQSAAQTQQKYVQSSVDNNFNSTREIIDISTKSMMEIMNIMHNNIKDNTNKVFNKRKA